MISVVAGLIETFRLHRAWPELDDQNGNMQMCSNIMLC